MYPEKFVIPNLSHACFGINKNFVCFLIYFSINISHSFYVNSTLVSHIYHLLTFLPAFESDVSFYAQELMSQCLP